MSGIIWISGLPGTGKTRLADAVAFKLRVLAVRTARIDGDVLRSQWGASNSAFDREARIALGLRYVRHAQQLAAEGAVVVASVVALFDVVRGALRESARPRLEVWLRAPEALRLQRAADQNDEWGPRMGRDIVPEYAVDAPLQLDNDAQPQTLDRLASEIVAAWFGLHVV